MRCGVTISFPLVRSRERRFHRGVIGESQGQTVATDLAPLGRPAPRPLDDLEVAREQVVDRVGGGWRTEAEPLEQLGEDGRALIRPQVEVAAEEQRRTAGPLVCGDGGAHHVLGGELGPVGAGVEVGDAEVVPGAGGDARERHCAPLQRTGVDRQLAPLDDPLGLLLPVFLMHLIGA